MSNELKLPTNLYDTNGDVKISLETDSFDQPYIQIGETIIKDEDDGVNINNYFFSANNNGVVATTATYTATITTTWTGAEAPYSQTISVQGILATDNPFVDVILDNTYSTAQAQQEDFAKIFKITTSANAITVYASEQTTVALPIQLKVVR